VQAFFIALGWTVAKAAVILATCVAIEWIASIERYSFKSRVPGILMYMIGGALSVLLAWPLASIWRSIGLGGIIVPLWDWLRPLPGGYVIQVIVVASALDLFRYWRHRAEHRWFWPIHAVHHSPTELHAANDIGHPFQVLPEFLFVTIPLSLVQLSGPGMPVVIGLLITAQSVYIHSPIDAHFGKWGRRILADNRFHRIHHSTESRHRDKNFSVCFSLWDWVFGTAYWPAKDEWPKVGIKGVIPPRTIGSFLRMPFKFRVEQSSNTDASGNAIRVTQNAR
jgi:sterol desaturase/sphingolipid hydroxylase (fatty acid hydroxylase superfamily)